MNAQMIWRIVWKDYRAYRPIWLALFAISIVIEVLLVIIGLWTADMSSVGEMPFVLVLGMPVVFAVAVSSVAFSQEHEVGTFDYLRSLPVRPLDLYLARMLHAALGAIALFLALLVLLPISLALAPPNAIVLGWGVNELAMAWVSIGLLAIAVGTFFSLLTKHPLRAAMLTAIAVCAAQAVGNYAVSSAARVQIWLLVAAVLLALDFVLVQLWMGESKVRRSHSLTRVATSFTRSAIFRSAAGRLCWIHLRRQGIAYGVMTAIVLFSLKTDHAQEAIQWLIAAQVIAGILGFSVFYVDRRDSGYRFFATHGVSPRLVWLMRHVIGLVLLTMYCVCLFFVMRWLIQPGNPSVLVLVFMPVLAYCGGQLMVLLVRSVLIGLFLTLLLTLISGIVCWIAYWLQIPWYIVIVPSLVASMIASWCHLPDWILERDEIRRRALPLGIALVGIIVSIAGISVYRVVDVPSVDAGTFATLTPASDPRTDQISAQAYLGQAADVVDRLPTSELEQRNWHPNDVDFSQSNLWVAPELDETTLQWLRHTEEALKKVETAFATSESPLYPVSSGLLEHLRPELSTLNRLLILKGRELQQEGDLDGAWQKYRLALEMSIQMQAEGGLVEWIAAGQNQNLVLEQLVWWAKAKHQTLERIREAIDYLIDLEERLPVCVESYSRQHAKKAEFIEDAPESLANAGWAIDHVQRTALVYRLMPWERTRSARALRYFEKGEREKLRSYMHALANELEVGQLLHEQSHFDSDPKVDRSILVPSLMTHSYFYTQQDSAVRNRLRASIVQLALIAWKKLHGHYPSPEVLRDELLASFVAEADSDEVREAKQREADAWLQRFGANADMMTVVEKDLGIKLPHDIFTGRPFVYLPAGKKCRLATDLGRHLVPYPIDYPFLWSPGVNLQLKAGADPTSHEAYQFRTPPSGRWEGATPEEVVWRAGTLFGL